MIVKTVCGWLKGFILLYGIHVILYGHLTPGGGFAGGVIAAAAFVLILLAEGEQAALQCFSRKAASTWDSVGVLVFLADGRERDAFGGNLLRQLLDNARVCAADIVQQRHHSAQQHRNRVEGLQFALPGPPGVDRSAFQP